MWCSGVENKIVSENPTKLSDICSQIKPKVEEHPIVQEKVTIVPKGPEMTPHMRSLVEAALLNLVKEGSEAVRKFDQVGLATHIKSTTHFIETLYLGTNKAMLKNYEQAVELEKAGKLIETSGEQCD